MRVLMLGWEFPPFISGGLGTACQGLTRAMTRLGTRILFVLPTAAPMEQLATSAAEASAADEPLRRRVKFVVVPCEYRSPYASATVAGCGAARPAGGLALAMEEETEEAEQAEEESTPTEPRLQVMGTGATGGYEGNLILRITEYADRCVQMTRHERFDVIHAHDWVTFPAGLAIARRSGRPVVMHVHSTEFDRSGEQVNQAVYDIERGGMHQGTRVIAVSNLTRRMVVNCYGVPEEKVHVVHNGIEPAARPDPPPRKDGQPKVVLFLGRITMQKGPEFFVRAAQRVLSKLDNVRFIIAGWGDQGPRLIEQVVNLGLGRKVQFTGFLRGREVELAYGMADVYVMPSVSEPFGLTALEAIQHGVPVVLSRNSGVAEVLRNGALKCNHWDIDGMADRIVAVLTRPELADALRAGGDREIRTLTWDAAARKCLGVYRGGIEAFRR